MSFHIDFDLSGFDRAVDAMADEVQQAVRPAAQAGAQVLYEAVKRNAPRSAKGHWFHGTSFKKNGKKYWFDAGTLSRAIYQVYSKDNSMPDKSVYHVSWNRQKAPYGFMVEYGTVKAPAHPFVRPAKALYPVALQACSAELFARLSSFK